MNKRLFAVVIVLVLMSSLVFAQTIKISSVAPASTPWGKGLNQLASEWAKISNGRVKVQIFHGGIAGTESDAVRKMRLGQLHGASASPVGLGAIVPDLWGMVVPGVIRDKDELEFVLADMENEFDAAFRKSGYEVLTWSSAGWMRYFSTQAISHPDDLKGLRIAAQDFDENINVILRNLGLQTVGSSSAEVLTSLNSGLLDTIMYVPLGVAGFQWFGVANKMTDVNIAPLYGAIIVDSRSWNRIPKQYHEEFKAVARRIGKDIEVELDKLEREAINIMKANGLEVVTSTASEKRAWEEVFANARRDLQDELFSPVLMQQLLASLNKYRTR